MASLSGVRANTFNENFLNETEQDANSVLTELDKGLRSPKIGVQCEAIVRFPRLFEKYPFPILINSSFLKLSEFFWNGSNLLRFWVLKVCQQSENHLDKILNIDAFVKRIFMVTHSNDPIARAIALRTLGAVSRIIPEKQQVHHSIRRSLDSHDLLEVEAAIYASRQFAAQSKSFAISMCSKIASMIESFQTPVSMKLQLIPVLQYMYHNANTAAMVKDICFELLSKYPAENFVVAILDSLTKLSNKTLIGIPSQIELLLKYLRDPRKVVRHQVLLSLMMLAKAKTAQSWPKYSVVNLISNAHTSIETREQILLLKVVYILSDDPLTCHSLLSESKKHIVEMCGNFLNLQNHTIASQALAILTRLVINCYTNLQAETTFIIELIDVHLESLIFSSVGKDTLTKELQKYLMCGVKLAKINSEFSVGFVEIVVDLFADEIEYPPKHSELLCHTLAALTSHFLLLKFITPNEKKINTRINPSVEILPQVYRKLNMIIDSKVNNKSTLMESIAAVMLQSLIGCCIPKTIYESFDRTSQVSIGWTQYRIGRTALRYGHHYLAYKIFSHLSQKVYLDNYYFYLHGLSELTQAECVLSCEDQTESSIMSMLDIDLKRIHCTSLTLGKRLEISIMLYWRAHSNLRASSSPECPLLFQLEFIKLRAQFLQTLLSVVVAKNAHAIVPPPAIAVNLAQTSRDSLQKFGHITNQLRKIVKNIKSSEESYNKLYKSSFDADPATLEFLELTEYQCALLANILESICYTTTPEVPSLYTIGNYPETRFLVTICNKMKSFLNNLPVEPANMKTITNKHIDVLINVVELITKSPLLLPRFFFQILQATRIKLSISPQARVAGEPITVQYGSNLVIRVEGVIQHYGTTCNLYRSIKSVQISVTSQLVTQRLTSDNLKLANDIIILTQTIKPNRDFLSGSFLLPISTGGQWQVNLETSVIDENGNVWCTGPKNSMIIRVLDDTPKVTAACSASISGQIRRF